MDQAQGATNTADFTDFKYVVLLTTNSLIFKEVNVNAQLIFWKNGRLLNESKLNLVDPDFYRPFGKYLRFMGINYLKRKKKRVVGKTVWVIDQWAVNYYHWFVEALPKILSTRLSSSEFVVMMPASYKGLSFHEDSLKMMGIRWNYFDDVNERLSCEELYLPLNVSVAGTANPLYINKLRSVLLTGIKTGGASRRIYVSRRSTKRRVANEDEVVAMLAPYGFEVMEFEKMTFIDQINACHSASMIIGLHGAGLTNILFMGGEATVVELRRENEDNFCFQYLAEALALRYRHFDCKNMGVDRYNSDFSVNLPEFKNFIQPLLS